MEILEFKDINQVKPHDREDSKRGIKIPHQGSEFKKAILEMSLSLTKYVA